MHYLREIMSQLKRKYPPRTAAWFAVKIGGLAKRELSAAAFPPECLRPTRAHAGEALENRHTTTLEAAIR